ncbi:hypothetical protein K438DRAFT_1969358 [Mycena galopus ATCC 62051]|nr:hypothetical protein K438DRAFT_1969358 [Mycena galopus ATCC 62051]
MSAAVSTRLGEIQEAIAWHREQIAILQAEANSLSPILVLPTEITSKIFASRALDSGARFDSSWSTVMFVCRRWYDIAISEQQLWGKIDISSPGKLSFLELLLRRSGVAPLSVKVSLLELPIHPFILQHSERLRELDLIGSARSVFAFAHAFGDHTFPVLRSIRLFPEQNWGDVPNHLTRTLPDAIFDGRAPCLTTLDLESIDVNWGAIRGLTSLSLSAVANTNAATTFLSVLQSSPALIHLQLKGIIGPETFQAHVVPLPLLQSLCIVDRASACTELLRLVPIPPGVRLSVDGWDVYTGHNLSQLLIPLRRYLRSPSAPVISGVRLDSAPTMLKVSTCTRVLGPNVLDGDTSALTLTTHPHSDNVHRQIMTKIFKMLPRASITQLDCRGAKHMTPTLWRAALALLRAVEVAYTVADITAIRLLTVLDQLIPKVAEYPPALRHIHITTLPGSDPTGLFRALHQFSAANHALGTPLEILEFDEQNMVLDIPKEDWDSLSTLVGTLIRNSCVYVPSGSRGVLVADGANTE